MPNNFFITGSPGSGKTTVIKKTSALLEEKGLDPGGIYCPDIRSDGRRKGFKIIDIMTGKSRILAHSELDKGPSVSKYRVNVSDVDEISEEAIPMALREADFVIIDEIAPMEVYSKTFRKYAKEAFDSKKPLLGVIHKRSESGYIGKIKERKDTQIFEINKKNRDEMPKKLTELILRNLKPVETDG